MGEGVLVTERVAVGCGWATEGVGAGVVVSVADGAAGDVGVDVEAIGVGWDPGLGRQATSNNRANSATGCKTRILLSVSSQTWRKPIIPPLAWWCESPIDWHV
jgi:hypothetical protein